MVDKGLFTRYGKVLTIIFMLGTCIRASFTKLPSIFSLSAPVFAKRMVASFGWAITRENLLCCPVKIFLTFGL